MTSVLNCPAERQQLNTERSARCPEPPPAAAGSQAQYQLQLKNRYERVSSSSSPKKNFCTEIVPDSLSKPSLSIRRPHPTLLHPISEINYQVQCHEISPEQSVSQVTSHHCHHQRFPHPDHQNVEEKSL